MNLPSIEKFVMEARTLAQDVSETVLEALSQKSTVGIERAVLRLLGISGTTSEGQPRANALVDRFRNRGWLSLGALTVMAQTAIALGADASDAADFQLSDEAALPAVEPDKVHDWIAGQAVSVKRRIDAVCSARESMLATLPVAAKPLRYLIVATGNIHEDVVQAALAARQGADVIAVIRSTAQALLDYVPEGLTTEGYGGTYATQANFRLMRQALDDCSRELGRYVRLTNYASGLCMAEMAALGAIERLDMMLSDSMYGILFRDINMQRTLIDQHAARRIQGMAGIVINTGEDNYLTTTDEKEAQHTVLASQFINEAFAHKSGIDDSLIGLGHAFEMSPDEEDGLLLQIADALLVRKCFPRSPIKYMPPTRYKDGNIFQAQVFDAFFNLVSVATEQDIHLLGVMTEGVHTPLLHDRLLSLKNFDYVSLAAKHFAAEFDIRCDGVIVRRTLEVQERTLALLQDVKDRGLFAAIEAGLFAGTIRTRDGGKGLEGVFDVDPEYSDPLNLLMGSAA